MRTLMRVIVSLVWALWFGGVITLFLSVTTLFRGDRAIAVEAAPRLFHAFERYQLLLAGIALLATFIWRVMVRSKRIAIVFTLLALATVAAVVETTAIAPKIDAMRINGQTHTAEFRRTHGMSMLVYVSEAAALLAGGIMISIAPATDNSSY